MGGDEVDRGERPPAALVVEVPGGGEASGDIRQLVFVAFPEGPHGVAEAVVPFRPAGREAADPIAARSAVPGLGDQLGLAQHRVLAAGDQETVAFVEAFRATAEDGRQVEAEAVHVHLRHPVAQRVGDHLQHAGVGRQAS